MTVLLTGGAGYIGSHTAVELINQGNDVIIADNFSNSSPDAVRRIGKIVKREVKCYEIDVSDGEAVNRVFRENKIDAVIHFAGLKSVEQSVSEPVEYYRVNLNTTLTLLEQMNRHGCKTLVFSSSAAVYGEPSSVPIGEDAPVGKCLSPYGRTKYFIEQILTDVCEADPKMSVLLLRYFNPIGAHESGYIGETVNGIPDNLLPIIIRAASGLTDKLTIFGNDYPTRDGTGVRDYIHVADLAKGHAAALRYAAAHSGAEPFNLGTGSGYSVLEIKDAFEKATGVRVPFVFSERRHGDIAQSYADPSKAEKLLGWKAEKTISDMCRDSWRWHQNQTRGVVGSGI